MKWAGLDGAHTFTNGAIDKLKSSLAEASVGAQSVQTLSSQAAGCGVFTLINVWPGRET